MIASGIPVDVPAPTAGTPIVRCRDVTKDFASGGQRVRALRGVNLLLRSGELTLLVGPSGCGKTTLLSVIAGILSPTAGDIETLGQPLVRLNGAQRARLRLLSIGFVFQAFNLVPTLTVAENVALPLLIAGRPRKAALRIAVEHLTAVGLREFGLASPGRLSGGEQQRVAFARALVHDPKLIVCDEPTSSLDAATGQRVMQTLREAALRPDRGVIVVTHDPRIRRFADRVVTMEDGIITRDENR